MATNALLQYLKLVLSTADLIADHSTLSVEHIADWINLDRDYPTPKLNVRALITHPTMHRK
ncbi:hypothetical protein [Burkholderia stabilis]|uniref:hypothetical protein n=1 Tax=Burkholderia stabilis TaxID=95485 RepID=UPI00080BEBAE|nr:hypothetical protein [Burkholderia stabilis]GAU05520.1 hypothetical protein BSLA_02f3892 [Burkholderia stabilis]